MTHDEQVLAINAAWTKVLATKVSKLSVKLVKVEAVQANAIIKGWRLVCPSGAILSGFTLRAQADSIANLINEELASALQQIKTEVNGAQHDNK